MNMNKIANTISIAAVSAALLVSCSDWTTPQSVEIQHPTAQESNPELYEKYLESLRAYKAGEHQIMIAKFENKNTVPSGRAEHLSCLPDSVDFIILNNADSLSETVCAEMEEVRIKGTSILYNIDFSVIEAEWKAMLEAEEGQEPEDTTQENTEGEEGNGEPSLEEHLAFIGERTDYYISLYAKYGYDGLNVGYKGVSPLSLNQEEKEETTALQEAFFGKIAQWKSENAEAVMMFEGNPENIILRTDILDAASYIIIPALDASTFEEFAIKVSLSAVEGVPSDRFVIGVTTRSVTDATDKNGIFPGVLNESAVIAAGQWAATVESEYVIGGVCVANAQNDYFNTTLVFQNIRGAIAIMNPSPIN